MKQKNTLAVSDPVFRQVYDSPLSLPERHKWLTRDAARLDNDNEWMKAKKSMCKKENKVNIRGIINETSATKYQLKSKVCSQSAPERAEAS